MIFLGYSITPAAKASIRLSIGAFLIGNSKNQNFIISLIIIIFNNHHSYIKLHYQTINRNLINFVHPSRVFNSTCFIDPISTQGL